MKKVLLIVSGLVALVAILGGLLYRKNHILQLGIANAEAEFANYVPPKVHDFGSVDHVSITPLQHNMAKLGIAMNDVDMIVISHNHFDHVGGKKWMDGKTFSPGNVQPDLGAKRIFTPIEMTYPGQHPVMTQVPQVLDSGIATIGTIPAELIIGKTYEQALAIHIKGKGLLLVVGCSHQTIPKIIKRTQDVFSEPIFAIIGGLHFPIPEGRLKLAGGLIDAQRLGSGRGPVDPLSQEDVDRNIRMLKDLNIQVIGVGGHDSSDEIIEQFKNEFGHAYRSVKVGLKIVL